MNEEAVLSDMGGLSRRKVLGTLLAASFLPVLAKAADPRPSARVAEPFHTIEGGAPRALHTVTALPDGRVVIAGGFIQGAAGAAPTASVEVFDPISGNWFKAAPMATPRARHAAVALPGGLVLVLGGYLDGPLSTTEVFDPSTNTWAKGPNLAFARGDHAAAFVNGQVVVTGGAGVGSVAPCEICDLGGNRPLKP